INRAVYATVKTEPTTTITSGAQLHTAPQKLGSPAIAPIACAWLRHAPQSTAACMTVSLATNPKNGGLPAMDTAPILATHIRAGCYLGSPDNLLRSLVPVILSTAPTTMSKGALTSAWTSNMASPATPLLAVPRPLATMSSPSCDTVPEAKTSITS